MAPDAVAALAEFPTLPAVRAWIGVDQSILSDEQLQLVIDAEAAIQAQLCAVEPWAAHLTQAIYRRVGRHVAAMGTPLGIAPDSEFGSAAALPRYDAEIERLERGSRRVVLG